MPLRDIRSGIFCFVMLGFCKAVRIARLIQAISGGMPVCSIGFFSMKYEEENDA